MSRQETFSQRQSRLAREENQGKRKGCFHDKEHWCGNCINFGTVVDLRSKGLGQGHIIGNVSIDLSSLPDKEP